MAQAGRGGTRVFASAPYEAGDEGVLEVVLPTACVFAGPGETCSVFIDHRRERKTGPRMRIAVVGCSVHPIQRYTVYPPGHYPYGREPAVATSVSGPLLRAAETGEPVWEATVMSAAVDAARGQRWPSDNPADDGPRRRTQGRRLELCGRLVGVHPALDDATRERIAQRLGVPTMTLRGAAQSWGKSWTTRGAAIVCVLLALSLDALLPRHVLFAGSIAGQWAPAHHWDPSRAAWVGSQSDPAERSVANQAGCRGPPPTSSPS